MNKKVCMMLVIPLVVTIKATNVIAGEDSIYGIHSAQSVEAMKPRFNKLIKTKEFDAKKAIAIFDEDNTLIYRYGHEVGNGDVQQWAQLALKILCSEKKNQKSIGQWKQIYHKNHIKLLVDQQLPELVRNLQTQGVKCSVLTSKLNEKLGIDTKGEKVGSHDIYDEEHKKFGFNFAIGWDNLPSTKLTPHRKGGLPDFIDGVIYAGKSQKGATYEQHNKVIALSRFIAYAQEHNQLKELNTIIAIDDRKSEIEALSQYAKAQNYRFVGFIFTGYKKFPIQKGFDVAYETARLEHLKQQNEWLLPQTKELFYKDEKGIWHLKEHTTSFMNSTMPSLENEVICKLFNPQGTIASNNERSLDILKQSPCEVTP